MINPPTDNLYKFCAIIGLILIIFNSYYNFEMLLDTGTELTKLIGEQKKHSIKLKSHEKITKDYTQELQNAIDLKNNFFKENERKLLALDQNKLSKKQHNELHIEIESTIQRDDKLDKNLAFLNKIRNEEYQSIQIEEVEIETKHGLIKQQQKRIDTYSNFMWLGVILGSFLSVYGFSNWIKIQKAMDKELSNENQTNNQI